MTLKNGPEVHIMEKIHDKVEFTGSTHDRIDLWTRFMFGPQRNESVIEQKHLDRLLIIYNIRTLEVAACANILGSTEFLVIKTRLAILCATQSH